MQTSVGENEIIYKNPNSGVLDFFCEGFCGGLVLPPLFS